MDLHWKLTSGTPSHGLTMGAFVPVLTGHFCTYACPLAREAEQMWPSKHHGLTDCAVMHVNARCPTVCNGFAALTHSFLDVPLLVF